MENRQFFKSLNPLAGGVKKILILKKKGTLKRVNLDKNSKDSTEFLFFLLK
jgi:hypothetical protein